MTYANVLLSDQGGRFYIGSTGELARTITEALRLGAFHLGHIL